VALRMVGNHRTYHHLRHVILLFWVPSQIPFVDLRLDRRLVTNTVTKKFGAADAGVAHAALPYPPSG